jgi:hypothetical protein
MYDSVMLGLPLSVTDIHVFGMSHPTIDVFFPMTCTPKWVQHNGA